jgi:hypothetical protein
VFTAAAAGAALSLLRADHRTGSGAGQPATHERLNLLRLRTTPSDDKNISSGLSIRARLVRRVSGGNKEEP